MSSGRPIEGNTAVGVYGADVTQLRGTAAELERAAEQLSAISSTLGSALESAPWHGADAASFRANWSSDYSRRIADGSARLREAARTLRANADDQEATSAASGGGPFGTGLVAPVGPGGIGGLPGGAHGGTPGSSVPTDGAQAEGGPKIVVGADGEVTPEGLAGRVGASAQFDDHWQVAGADVHREGDYGVGAKGEVGTKFSFSGDEEKAFDGDKWGHDIEKGQTDPLFEAGVEASGKAGAWAEDKVTAEAGIASVNAGYEALAGARGELGAGAELSADGAKVGVSAGGFAGAEAKGTVGGEIAGVSGNLTAGVRAGIGAEASANIDLGLDKVKVEFELGASLGIGASIKPSFEFSPSEMVSDARKLFGL